MEQLYSSSAITSSIISAMGWLPFPPLPPWFVTPCSSSPLHLSSCPYSSARLRLRLPRPPLQQAREVIGFVTVLAADVGPWGSAEARTEALRRALMGEAGGGGDIGLVTMSLRGDSGWAGGAASIQQLVDSLQGAGLAARAAAAERGERAARGVDSAAASGESTAGVFAGHLKAEAKGDPPPRARLPPPPYIHWCVLPSPIHVNAVLPGR